MKEFIVETDLDLSCVTEFTGAGGVSFKPHGELIRCRDCEHRRPIKGVAVGCVLFGLITTKDDFCSFAVRKD